VGFFKKLFKGIGKVVKGIGKGIGKVAKGAGGFLFKQALSFVPGGGLIRKGLRVVGGAFTRKLFKGRSRQPSLSTLPLRRPALTQIGRSFTSVQSQVFGGQPSTRRGTLLGRFRQKTFEQRQLSNLNISSEPLGIFDGKKKKTSTNE